MEASVAEKRGLEPLGIYRGMAVAGTEPDEMGIGPIYAVPKLLKAHGLSMDDIGLWELNEAFAAQGLASLRKLGLPDDAEHVNPNGGAIALGHPLGMSGARLVTTAAHELRRQNGSYALCTMCIGVGQGIAMVIEPPTWSANLVVHGHMADPARPAARSVVTSTSSLKGTRLKRLVSQTRGDISMARGSPSRINSRRSSREA